MDIVDYWEEDEFHPVTEADLLHLRRFAYLVDTEGWDVAKLWEEMGCPEQFHWTEIRREGS